MRSLVLAGGGMKVAYQAGCLEVFDRLSLTFDHIDSASGGCLNAAMLADGMTGTQIANHWRTMDPFAFTSIDWRHLYRGLWMRSIGTDAGIRRVIRNILQLDFDRIQGCMSPAFTFNIYDFTNKRVEIVENKQMTEARLIAATTLLGFLPPVASGRNRFFDAVWCSDGNLGESVRRGADEIWAIWTVSDTPELRDGVFAQYFHLIETVANGKFKEGWGEIAAVNEAIRDHDPVLGRAPDLQLCVPYDPQTKTPLPPPGRKTIRQHLIRQEVPVHYVFIKSRDRIAAAVEMGVADTIAYMRTIGMLPPNGAAYAVPRVPQVPAVAIDFSETMRGFFMPGDSAPTHAERAGRRVGNALVARLTISTQDLTPFLHRPEHLGTVSGTIDCPILCGSLMTISTGTFALFVNDRENNINLPGKKRMSYQLEFADLRGRQYRLFGEKFVRDGRGMTAWPDTTTLYVNLESRLAGAAWAPFGAGVIHVLLLDFLKELGTFRVRNASGPDEAATALRRFGLFWVGQLWDVYARGVLDYAPF